MFEDLLDDLHAHCTYHHGSRGGDSGNDLTSDELDLEVIDFLDLIVPSAKIGDTGDLFNVVIGWVILLELDQVPLPTSIKFLR